MQVETCLGKNKEKKFLFSDRSKLIHLVTKHDTLIEMTEA